jgi:hypothetical protein
MVFNSTFNNISVISWRSVLLVEETQGTWRKPQTTYKLYHMMLYKRTKNDRLENLYLKTTNRKIIQHRPPHGNKPTCRDWL